MREKVILLVLILAIAFTTVSFINMMAERQVGIDSINRDFGELNNILPPNANISLAGVAIDSSGFHQLFTMVRYVLAPRYASFDAVRYDTVLTFFGKVPDAAELHKVVGNGKVLWQLKGGNALFILTARN